MNHLQFVVPSFFLLVRHSFQYFFIFPVFVNLFWFYFFLDGLSSVCVTISISDMFFFSLSLLRNILSLSLFPLLFEAISYFSFSFYSRMFQSLGRLFLLLYFVANIFFCFIMNYFSLSLSVLVMFYIFIVLNYFLLLIFVYLPFFSHVSYPLFPSCD